MLHLCYRNCQNPVPQTCCLDFARVRLLVRIFHGNDADGDGADGDGDAAADGDDDTDGVLFDKHPSHRGAFHPCHRHPSRWCACDCLLVMEVEHQQIVATKLEN